MLDALLSWLVIPLALQLGGDHAECLAEISLSTDYIVLVTRNY